MITLANGVQVPDGSDLLDLSDPTNSILARLSRSFSDAIGGLGAGKRQPRTYAVANQTEKTALAGLTGGQISGDRVFVADSAAWEIYDTDAWKVWLTTKAISWPFAHTAVSVGNGISSFGYHVYGDLISLTGVFTFGSSTGVSAAGNSGNLVLPFGMWVNGAASVIGTCLAANPGGTFHSGIVVGAASSPTTLATTLFDTGASNGSLSRLSSAVPRAWTSGDRLSLNVRWRRA